MHPKMIFIILKNLSLMPQNSRAIDISVQFHKGHFGLYIVSALKLHVISMFMLIAFTT